MDKKFKILIVCCVLVVSGAFYWYSARPTSIKKQCNRQAALDAQLEYDKTMIDKSDYNFYYSRCLRSNGL